jgi:hypothetical protein
MNQNFTKIGMGCSTRLDSVPELQIDCVSVTVTPILGLGAGMVLALLSMCQCEPAIYRKSEYVSPNPVLRPLLGAPEACLELQTLMCTSSKLNVARLLGEPQNVLVDMFIGSVLDCTLPQNLSVRVDPVMSVNVCHWELPVHFFGGLGLSNF